MTDDSSSKELCQETTHLRESTDGSVMLLVGMPSIRLSKIVKSIGRNGWIEDLGSRQLACSTRTAICGSWGLTTIAAE